MLHASEAKNLVQEYYEKITGETLNAIEDYIRQVARNGGCSCTGAFNLQALKPAARIAVLGILTKAGYHVEYTKDRERIIISWSNP